MKKVFCLGIIISDPITVTLIGNVSEGIKLIGLPRVQKLSLFIYGASRWLDYSENPDKYFQALRELTENIQLKIMKDFTIKDYQVFLANKKGNLEIIDDPKSKSETNKTEKKNFSSERVGVFQYFREYILLSISINTGYYCSKTFENEEEKISLQNEIISYYPLFCNYYVLDPLTEDYNALIKFIQNIWCNRILNILKELLFVLLHFFKEHYKEKDEEKQDMIKILTRLVISLFFLFQGYKLFIFRCKGIRNFESFT